MISSPLLPTCSLTLAIASSPELCGCRTYRYRLGMLVFELGRLYSSGVFSPGRRQFLLRSLDVEPVHGVQHTLRLDLPVLFTLVLMGLAEAGAGVDLPDSGFERGALYRGLSGYDESETVLEWSCTARPVPGLRGFQRGLRHRACCCAFLRLAALSTWKKSKVSYDRLT